MTRAVGNGMIQTLANAIGTGAVGKLAKQVAGLSTDMANIKTPDKGSGLMFNPDTGKLYIPCGNGVTVNKNTGMLEVPIGDNLRYTGSGLDVPDAAETTAGVVKLTHVVSNRDDGEWAITADGVYAYTPGYNTKAVDVKSMVTLVNGIAHMAQVAGGVLFLEIVKDETWAKGELAITLNGYGTNGNFVYYGGIAGYDGDTPKQCTFNCSNIGGSIQLAPQQAIVERKLHISIPVYKL
jgi:hypothetical protein|nr:MAG TPA: hypothetical protein [Caudoviricetes sp.]